MQNLVEIRDLRLEATTDAGNVIPIIKGVSLDIAPGEILALIGESGSGKTTIALTLMAHTRRGCRITGGSVRVNGRDLVTMTERQRQALRGTEVAYVPQSAAAAFNPALTLMDQVIEVARIHRLMPMAQARAKAVDLFRALALPDPETIGARYPHQVSGGQLQRLSAAMALIGDPQLVIFDEPTTALDVTTQIEVLRAFKSVMRAGHMAGVYVSHDLAVVAQIADRIAVLRGGEVQEIGTTDQILHRPVHPYTRELLAAFEPATYARPLPATAEAPAPVLDVANVTAGYGPLGPDGKPFKLALKDVSCRLDRGRNLGVIGESGSGKSTLASVAEILSRPLDFYHGLTSPARQARLHQLLDMVRLPKALAHRLPGELSGGQKQRVNLARALAANPEVILCDEITSALDTVVAAAVIELLKDLQRDLDLSYVFISHDLSTVQAICDQVMVMNDGAVVETLGIDQLPDGARHPYSKLLFNSVPQLDPGWLDRVPMRP